MVLYLRQKIVRFTSFLWSFCIEVSTFLPIKILLATLQPTTSTILHPVLIFLKYYNFIILIIIIAPKCQANIIGNFRSF